MSNTDTQGRDRAAQPPDEDSREAAAGAQLSTAPREELLATLSSGPSLGVIGWARWFWRQLTSMRVALILLFLLSLAAIPGSLIPQRMVDDLKVQTWKENNEFWAPVFEKLQLFDVYSSVWFSAIYILLFVSLIGCIVPRSWQFVGQLRGRPPAAPGRLTRMPAYTTWRTDAEPEQVREAALALLKKRRFRARIAGDAVAAEKGYLREAGNLVFHVALIVMLLAFAAGQLFKSEGGKLIVEGDGFANTLTQYDDFRSGALYDADNLDRFWFDLKSFTATYEKSGPQKGTARTFEAAIRWGKPGGKEQDAVIEVNKPLTIDGSKIHLLSHGYAPVITVRDGRGKVVLDKAAVPLLPVDGNITSSGAIKVMDGYRDKNGKKDQLGFKAWFVPTFGSKEEHGGGTSAGNPMFSTFPALDFPVLAVNAYRGSLGVDSGLPQNVYQLDTRKLVQFKDEKGEILKALLMPGESMKLPDGAGSITYESTVEWASFQISERPGNGWALAGGIAAIAGLAASLFVQRRRVWVRAVTGRDGVTVVEMAGLGRSESAKLPEELGDLAAQLHGQAPSAPDPEPGENDAEPSPPAKTTDTGSGGSEVSTSTDPHDPAVTSEGAEK
ncbi:MULTISPECIES: cytochrome c biogenesis protein ResB [Streptomyces]|uniref:Cytochrome c biogenesis protein ResB n=1 Tax=Streptomyces tsukubensis (strain DSM 42081 / NBRC 108919 / NRRL 18488 / 9993) TaxID=1114943 RepID=I2N3Z7_STRT9|nr:MULTISPECIES: cytochrome c biogenesis protein ResB [Streptomyces]AZK95809.1 cytochrome C biogenesis protein [Streptomyces tsukubensis]EIF91744.1 cytochrome c biogenesis membrane protein [Streptomyces tsukubensis NRRL18488]MYS65612.1 cytochrome c biogenesis protein ResB [Streptomyces sp. SID5473]QKM68166.1 cytochrome c biogenesis protein ResB [Streptomyces tsukubensis NRRL18488]TAI44567.1 cytochrome c biogenesis protein ResB [Streptomyces tsukubensis]